MDGTAAADLILGYGNDLRGDDGAGPCVAEAVRAWCLPGVMALALHQLAPELAVALAAARRAVFVDASVGPETAVLLTPIAPLADPAGIGHTSDPRRLLALTQTLFGRCPEAWHLRVPALRFDFGEALSPLAARGVREALVLLTRLLEPPQHGDAPAP
jgi:hydrogenase maturation protease